MLPLALTLAACGGGSAAPSSAPASSAAASKPVSAPATSAVSGSGATAPGASSVAVGGSAAGASAGAAAGSAAAPNGGAAGGSAASASGGAVGSSAAGTNGASAGSAASGASAALGTAPAAAASAAPAQSVDVTLALGYIPNIQFAPFYVAQAKGYFKDEGINISFDNGTSPDLIKSVGAGKFKFAIADADTVISARAENIPVTYVAGLFAQTPNAIITLPKSGITQPAQLKGKKVGIPGRYGSSYIGLLGVLNKAGLKESDIDLQEINYTQAQQLLAGKVDAVVGFANNDALQVQAGSNGTKPNVMMFGDQIPFVGTGLITNDDTLKNNPKLVQGMVRAMLRGMQSSAQDQGGAFDTTIKVVPEAGGQASQLNKDVLAATVPLFQNAGTQANGLGWTDPAAWKAMADTMVSAGILKTAPNMDQVVTNQFISKDIT
ncbi:MAG TPA: ABC transporter substrate-binding protein [Chloroflexota bacterium]|nr:ABC transporter substrate-binding protein [Chloroflexota bacterium]